LPRSGDSFHTLSYTRLARFEPQTICRTQFEEMAFSTLVLDCRI
jgi:hypothetical protein